MVWFFDEAMNSFYRRAFFFLLSLWIFTFLWIVNQCLQTRISKQQGMSSRNESNRSSIMNYEMETFNESDINNKFKTESLTFNASEPGLFCRLPSNWYLRYFSTKVTTNFSSWTYQQEQNCTNVHVGERIRNIQPKLTLTLTCDDKTVHIKQTQVESRQLRDEKIPCFNFGDKCLTAFLDKCCQDNTRVPNIVHYVIYKKATLTFFEFVSFVSVIRFVRPCVILIHGDALPTGIYWIYILKLSPNIIHVKWKPPNDIFGQTIIFKEHAGDLMRIKALLMYGGIYLDTDMVIVNSLEAFRKYPCTMSQQAGYMASAFIMAEKNAMFLRKWINGYRYDYNVSSYVYNAMIYPKRIYKRFRDLIHVENGTISRPITQIGQGVYKTNFDWRDIYGFHLFSRSYSKYITLETVKYFNSTVGSICRHVLFGNKELCLYPLI